MGRFVVIVLDGFGVGAMDDVSEVRPRDIGSNTALHIIERNPDIKLTTLENMGLINAIGLEYKEHKFSTTANWGRASLKHQGADTFMGHHEIMGTKPKLPLIEPFHEKIDVIEQNLLLHGYQVRRYGAIDEPKILIVNECATVADNLETDLGQVYNVTACLDLISFDELKKLGNVVREVSNVSRVIAFGGENVSLSDLLAARKVKNNEIVGIDAPESGVYKQGYQVVHIGFGIDPIVQIQTKLELAGIEVSLLGKFADIIEVKGNRIFSGVDTKMLFDHALEEIEEISNGLIALNIQETDLAGHSEDISRYSSLLELCDRRIAEIISVLNKGDILLVMADHGNDPSIGHSNHTREWVPILVYTQGIKGKHISDRSTMSDVAATISEYFHVDAPQNGQSFLSEIIG